MQRKWIKIEWKALICIVFNQLSILVALNRNWKESQKAPFIIFTPKQQNLH